MNLVFRPIGLPLLLLGLAWTQEIVDQIAFGGRWNLPMGAGLPWWGIFTAPFSHMGFAHLLANTVAFLPLSWLVISKSFRSYLAVWAGVLFLEIPMATFWPNATHGLSGVIYGLLGYLFFIGFLERRIIPLMLSLFCIFFYGDSLFALIPFFSPAGVSWMGHLSGFVGGLLAASALYRAPSLKKE